MYEKISLFKENCVCEKNTCANYHEGICIKLGERCPSIVKYNDNNDNNTPCDLAGYKPVG